MGSAIDGIIMVKLENFIVPRLLNHLSFWKKYVDDTFIFVKEESITFVLEWSNIYHPKLQFNHKLETEGTLILRKTSKFETALYRKRKIQIFTMTGFHTPKYLEKRSAKNDLNPFLAALSNSEHYLYDI